MLSGTVFEHALSNHVLQDPFLVISKIAESGIPIPICKTEVVKDNLDPAWKPVFLNIQQVGSKVCGAYFTFRCMSKFFSVF